jgi:DNA integrity scanning protein DisA with diadenylate cyclase activity
MNGFELSEDTLKVQLDYIRQEKKEVEEIIEKLQALPSYQLKSDDAQSILMGWSRIRRELNYMLRRDYDAEIK